MPWIEGGRLSTGVVNNFLRTIVVLLKGECRIKYWASLFEPWKARGLSRQDASIGERIGRKQEEELQGVFERNEQRAMAEPQAGALTQATYPLDLRFPSPSVAFASRLSPRGVACPGKPTRSYGAAIIKSHTKVSLRHKTLRSRKRPLLQVCAAGDASDGRRWWQKGGKANLRDVNSTMEFLDALSNAGEKLVVVEFFATWCGSCKALYPKLCQIAAEHPDIEFFKVNLDENKTLCKSLDVKVLPFFHFYRGADGRLDAFSCSQSKLAKLRDAISRHNTDRCSIGPPSGLGEETGLLGLGTQVTAGTAV